MEQDPMQKDKKKKRGMKGEASLCGPWMTPHHQSAALLFTVRGLFILTNKMYNLYHF